MIRLCHMTDIHISRVGPTLRRFFTGKRVLGGSNMLLFRRRQMRNEYLPYFVEHILQQDCDMVMVSGDLSTTALHEEFALAREQLMPLIEAQKLVTVPGNHDVYTRGALRERRYEQYFGDCHGEPPQGGGDYPFVRLVGSNTAIIGVNTCVPTGLSGAWGVVDAVQLARLGDVLHDHADKCRVVMLHHFLQDHHGSPGDNRRWIRNRGAVLEVFRKHGAELLVHGHKHAVYHYEIEGPKAAIPVYNPGPTTWHGVRPELQGGYQIYEFDGPTLTRALRYRFDPVSKQFRELTL